MPFGDPGAYWLLIGPQLELRRTTYDLADAARRIGATAAPGAAEFAASHVTNPPAERDMLERFTRAGIA